MEGDFILCMDIAEMFCEVNFLILKHSQSVMYKSKCLTAIGFSRCGTIW